ncbi:24926_t:CDS:2 [Entrophospora sp. SA101]|nr:14096_t:CDS:2 [Entrophospora sp. SA101]CAJ0747072.1 24926_t:CDS:2 [Entrophospora sp. SA101]CAJ0830388.1 1847_t:CDS:2 [Entrophospora sp. SA101]CAJ0836295.1 2052_t:CDS:2 [Entrophospora sp. SA101]
MKLSQLQELAKKVQLEIKSEETEYLLTSFSKLEEMLAKFQQSQLKDSQPYQKQTKLTLRNLHQLTKAYSTHSIKKETVRLFRPKGDGEANELESLLKEQIFLVACVLTIAIFWANQKPKVTRNKKKILTPSFLKYFDMTKNDYPRIKDPNFFTISAVELAQKLLGKILVRNLNGQIIKVKIVETEAYIGDPQGVLIRAAETLDRHTVPVISQHDKRKKYHYYTNGPGKLCRALSIDISLNNVDLTTSNLIYLEDQPELNQEEIVATKRVNIDYAGSDKDRL